MKGNLVTTLVLATALSMPVLTASAKAENKENNTEVSAQKKKKPEQKDQKKKSDSFWKKSIKWFGKNWSAYDPKYSTPSFYNWVGQLQNNFAEEWFSMKQDGGMEVNMHSKLSSKFGPYLGWNWLGYGLSVDLMTLGSDKVKKTDFGLNINSNLMNIEIFYRKTGGDFVMSKMASPIYDATIGDYVVEDLTSMADGYNIGERVNYYNVGFNANFFTNHKKYSNPAAFSNGAIQLRSCGSPIIGFGYTHQNLKNTISDIVEQKAMGSVFEGIATKMGGVDKANAIIQQLGQNQGLPFTNAQELTDWLNNTDDMPKFKSVVKQLINPTVDPTNPTQVAAKSLLQAYIFGQKDASGNIVPGTTTVLNLLLNKMPSKILIDDWHLNLGYAYNVVFSKRLLLGLSAIVSPSIKRVRMDNSNNMTYIAAEEFADAMNGYYNKETIEALVDRDKVLPEDFRMDISKTTLGANIYGRASLTYNFNRWRAGINAQANGYFYRSEGAHVSSIFGNANIYVGYCFGRKAQYRWNGKDREAYVMAALTKKQIAEMKDTKPAGNLGVTNVPADGKKTKYKKDIFDFSFSGCDLVKGPDGTYGTYVIEDGYITPGQDTEGRLRPGTVIPVNQNGNFSISCGRDKSFRAANWWKSQLALRQTPTNYYPEMLDYALRGTLTLWIRNYRLGSVEPVKLVLKDFCINRGVETEPFFQIASKHFNSHSAYSIIGDVAINGRRVRIYIESKHNGTKNYINVCPMKASTLDWMSKVPDDRPVSRLSIPGTHDAGTASLPEGRLTSMAHTQNLTIAEQLEDGIRAFDIRLKENMKFGHTMMCRDGFPETVDSIKKFLDKHPSEFVVALIGSDEKGNWSEDMKRNYTKLINKYPGLFIENFDARTRIGDVRGKILTIKRKAECPFGKLVKFQDNAIFEDNGFVVEDIYKEHKTYNKIKIVEKQIRAAHENLDPDKWYLTFNTIAWSPRHHKPYYSAWGAVNVRKPMNPSLREVIELKSYSNFGIIFLDFYNDHCDRPQLVEAIIKSNFSADIEKDYIPMK